MIIRNSKKSYVYMYITQVRQNQVQSQIDIFYELRLNLKNFSFLFRVSSIIGLNLFKMFRVSPLSSVIALSLNRLSVALE